jgi:hypothetical protein
LNQLVTKWRSNKPGVELHRVDASKKQLGVRICIYAH